MAHGFWMRQRMAVQVLGTISKDNKDLKTKQLRR